MLRRRVPQGAQSSNIECEVCVDKSDSVSVTVAKIICMRLLINYQLWLNINFVAEVLIKCENDGLVMDMFKDKVQSCAFYKSLAVTQSYEMAKLAK